MKITFVLTLSTSKDIDLVINILFPSIIKFFNLSDLEKFYIILKSKEIDLFNLYKNTTSIDFEKLKIEIIDESELLNTDNIYNTYYLQMLLKLLIANKINTTHYLTLDSDVYFCKSSSSSSFFTNKAYYQKYNKTDKWIERVNSILDVNIKYITNQTPFVFITEVVNHMCNDLDVHSLILNSNCSEYTLYLGYLIKTELLHDLYELKTFTGTNINHNIIKNITKDKEIIIGENFLLNDNQVISVIQSRTNYHNIIINILNNYIPEISFNKKKIAILTIVTNDDYFKTYKAAFFTKKKYCENHNYYFEFHIMDNSKYSKNNGWLKIIKLKEIIEKYDYVFMSDADVIITNNDIRLEDLILEYNLNNYMMLITTDWNSINTGNILWRNCKETIDFINQILDLGDDQNRNSIQEPYNTIGIYEQPTIIYLINSYEYIRNNIKIIPQFKLNSYLDNLPVSNKNNIITDIDGTINRCTWEPGDFLIHFAGCNYNNNIINENININLLIKKYILYYKIFIIRKEGKDYGTIK
uniref:Nucleotide-diphospho-sugar transferase domain-containing protein n=1 Tax=viral metagenome TaxID=1070528 RepID=A0A6C0J9E2_9ZZZZ